MGFLHKNVINSRATLTSYILTMLGISNHNIELDEDTINYCIDSTIDRFISVAYDGYIHNYAVFDIQVGVQEYTTPDNIIHVVDIFKDTGLSIGTDISAGMGKYMFNPILTSNTISGRFDFLGYNLTMNYLTELEESLITPMIHYYNGTTKTLTLAEVPQENASILLEVFTYPANLDNVEGISSIYGHEWVKSMSYAMCLKIWGMHLIKFRSESFDGNANVDKEAILAEGKELVEKYEQQLYDEFDASQEIVIKIG